MKRVLLAGLLVAGVIHSTPAAGDESWRVDWAVGGPFAIEIDVSGLSLPTAIAFVSDPGTDPKDPLYFVVELDGTVSAVTNDRTVAHFASVPSVIPNTELPDPSAQVGAAGICLDNSAGYVFVTFASRHPGGTLENRVVRFRTTPEVFDTVFTEVVEIAPLLASFQSAPSHQIGGCATEDGRLYVGIGDGRDVAAASRREDLLGKVVAMDLDGHPLATNPFSADDSEAARYVYAMGFRNPFAIGVYEGLVTIIDNGLSIDRLVIAKSGVDYLWDGSDASIAASATAIIAPGPAAVHLDRANPRGPLGDGIFYSASSRDEGIGGLWFLPFDFTLGLATGKSQQIVQYTGEQYSPVTGVATGPDGMYFTPLSPGADGAISVLKLLHRPDEPHPIAIAPPTNDMFSQLGCVTCHERNGTGADIGPSLDFFHEENRDRVLSMIESEEFEKMLRQLDQRTDEPFVSTRDARAEVLSLSGLARLRAYVKHKALEPRFADPGAAMPQLGLTEDQARAVSTELAAPWEIRVSMVEQALRHWFPIPETRVGDIVVGSIFGAVVIAIGLSLIRIVRRFSNAGKKMG